MLIELYSLDRTGEALRAIIGSKSAIYLQRGPVVPKFQVEGVAPTNLSPSQKTRQNGLSYGIKIWTDFSLVLSQCTRLTDRQTDRRTDRNLIARPRLHCMQRGNNYSERLSLCQPCDASLSFKAHILGANRLDKTTMYTNNKSSSAANKIQLPSRRSAVSI